MGRILHDIQLHTHIPRNVNELHANEQKNATFHQRLAVSITTMTGTMTCAYVFLGIAILGFPFFSNIFGPWLSLLIVWVSQTCIQLTMLPILSVGQSVLGRKAEIQADEQYATTLKIYHDIEQLSQHLRAQDEETVKQTIIISQTLTMLTQEVQILKQLTEK